MAEADVVLRTEGDGGNGGQATRIQMKPRMASALRNMSTRQRLRRKLQVNSEG